MNTLLPIIILILLAVVYAGTLVSSNARLLVVTGMLVFIVVACFLHMREGFQGYAPLDYSMGKCGGYKYGDLTPKMGPLDNYDGLVLKDDQVRRPLMKSPIIFSPVGDAVELTEDLASDKFPTIDGQKGSPKHLFMFANNVRDWSCCGSSQYSSDSSGQGCMCVSPEQVRMLSRRGSNRDYYMYPDM